MKKFISSVMPGIIMVFSLLGFTLTSAAQTYDEPVITFKTSIYEKNGETNQFSLVIGTVDSCQYVDVDCGYGKIEYETQMATLDSLSQMGGTFIECQVSKEGIVKIYGDPTQIDYLNASGCYITEIEFADLPNMSILDLSHNELKSLDLSSMSSIQALYLSDNTFSAESPLKIGANKPNLRILEMNTIDYLDQSFNLSDYPELVSFDGYCNLGLKSCDPSGCPKLLRLTLDVTPVETIDVSNNPALLILNVSNTRITDLDVSNNRYLTQLYCDHTGSYNNEYKIETLDVTNNPELQYLFCAGNKLTNLDISKCPKLVTLSATDNYLTSIDVSKNPELYIVEINKNCMDFATLPIDPGDWNTYYYGQRNFPVEKSYKVGSVFDYSARVLREGSVTDAVLYSVSETSPESASPVDASYYTYADGVLTINRIPEDSVYIAFANELFPEAILRTDKFKVKSEDDYGKDVKAFSFTAGVTAGTSISFGIGIAGASEQNPKTFKVNFGDGNYQTFTATTANAPALANVNGKCAGYGPIEVYIPDGELLSAVDVNNIPMFSVDVTPSAALVFLRLANAGLYTIDLSWNKCLRSLDLSGNEISALSLAGNNGSYEKNALADINLSNNNISTLVLSNIKAIKNLDLSNNQLTEIDLSDADYILSANLSNNRFETLDFTYCSIMTSLDVSYNNLVSIVLPAECSLEKFACNNNRFTLANLPEHGNLKDENYIYAPQADFAIPTKGPGIDLSELNRVINGAGTVYTWRDADGNALVEGVDYTNNNGVMVFKNIEVGNIVCEMTSAAYPGFSGENVYKTTPILAAAMPTNVVATFTTLNDADIVSLSLAAEKAGTAIYIGWDGNENLSQYMLETTYKIFSASTKANATVNVYTYGDDEKVSVFSMTGAKLSSCDLSKLTDAICINVSDAGLSEIKLPETGVLSELVLDGNDFTSFDVSKHPALRIFSINHNQLTSLDVTSLQSLETLSASGNLLSELKLNNPRLWALYLDSNNFSEISFDGALNISQLTLSNNQLSSINVDVLSDLRVLSLTNNKFTFATLPLAKPAYSVYYYSNQAPLSVVAVDGKVDLSSQATVNDIETVYRWFLDAPELNVETGLLEGEELIVDTEYVINGGVTEFLRSFDDVMCVMTNAALPNVYLYTNLLNVVSGVEDIVADNQDDSSVGYYNLQGMKVESPDKGIYIRVQGNKATKVYIK